MKSESPSAFCLPASCTLADAVQRAKQYLFACGVADAAADAWYILEYAAGMSRASFLAERRALFPEAKKSSYIALIQARGSRIPLQYLTGCQEFMGLNFKVTPDVLIPRQDTETLAEEALAWLRTQSDGERGAARVLDLCTGSGCLAVSLARLGQPLEVWASDLSGAALAVARENAARLKAPVHFVQSDLFEKFDCVEPFDLIVSNPPYVTDAEMETLEDEVRLHEPHTALRGGKDGLIFYRKIIRESRSYLRPEGCLMFEIGWNQAAAVTELMRQNGFSDVRVRRDLAGRDRVARGQLS